MIYVRVELWPRGDRSRARVLGEAEIANDGRGTVARGDYVVRLLKWGVGRRTWRTGRVEGFARKSLGPWDLLFRSLAACVGDRAKSVRVPVDEQLTLDERPIADVAEET